VDARLPPLLAAAAPLPKLGAGADQTRKPFPVRPPILQADENLPLVKSCTLHCRPLHFAHPARARSDFRGFAPTRYGPSLA
jgi:hypothetical protein